MAATQQPPPARGGMNLTSTWNGLPVWAWLGVGGLSVAGLYVFAKRYRAASAAKAPASANATQGPTSDYPLVIPLPGPPGQSIKGDPGAPGPRGVPYPVPTPIPTPPPVQTPPPPPQPLAPPETPPERHYTVVPGDSLWRIAARPEFYNNGALWPQIYAANRDAVGPNPNLIHPGLDLVIP